MPTEERARIESRSWLRAETIFDFVLLLLGVAIAYVSWGYGFGSFARPGPGLYPFFVGAAIVAFAASILLSNPKRKGEPVVDRQGARTIALITITACLWILAMPFLGYPLVTFFATYAFCKAMKLEGWRKPLAVSAGTALFIFLMFDYWLYIDLPRGIFG